MSGDQTLHTTEAAAKGGWQTKESIMASVASIGLSVMGTLMAGHSRKKGGHALTVYNRNSVTADAWVTEFVGSAAATPAAAAKGADVVSCSVGNAAAIMHSAPPAEGGAELDHTPSRAVPSLTLA